MNKTQIMELFRVNLLYASPQTTNQQRQKGKSGKKLTRALLGQYLLSGVFITAVYSVMMVPVNFPKYPGFFTFYCLMFVAFMVAQSVSILYNVFFESKDLKDYLPLPFKRSSVFFAKFLIVALTVCPFLLPLLCLFLLTSIRSTVPLIPAIFLSLFLFVLFFAVMLSFITIIVSFLVQTKIFSKHQKTFTTLLMLVPMIGMLAGIMYLQMKQTSATSGSGMTDQSMIHLFYPLFQILVHPLSILGIVSIIALVVLLYVLVLVMRKTVIPKMYAYASGDLHSAEAPAKSNTRKKTKENHYYPLKRQLFAYNFSLIKNPTLMLQFFTMTILLPVIMIFSMLMTKVNLSNAPMKAWLISVLVGLFYGFITLTTSSIPSLIISLDRENFLYIRSLPIDFRNYLKEKFLFAYVLQTSVTGLVILVLSLLLHLPVLFLLGALLGDFVGIFVFSQFYFYRDYRYLNLNWTSISQLFTRGGGTMAQSAMLIGGMIAWTILIVLVIFGVMLTPFALPITIVLLGLLALGTVLAILHYKKVFWDGVLKEQ